MKGQTMSEKTIAIKAQQVDEVADLFKESVSSVVVDVRGLTVAQADDLRSQLRSEGISLRVIKNKILTRAAQKAGYEDLNNVFVGPSAVAFSSQDAVAPARILKKFSDAVEALELKGGVVDGKVASLDEVNRYAALPSREALLGQLMAEFQYPLRSFMYAVKAISEKRIADGEEVPVQEEESPASEATVTEEKPADEVQAETTVQEESSAVAEEATQDAEQTENKEESAE
jgi:large subunit ribosomal protein L10